MAQQLADGHEVHARLCEQGRAGVPHVVEGLDGMPVRSRAAWYWRLRLLWSSGVRIVVRVVVESARRTYPRLPIVARTHSSAEREVLERLGASQVIVGEIELGLEMTRFTLRQFGISSREADLIVTGLRGR
jgi:hypothetical protein